MKYYRCAICDNKTRHNKLKPFNLTEHENFKELVSKNAVFFIRKNPGGKNKYGMYLCKKCFKVETMKKALKYGIDS